MFLPRVLRPLPADPVTDERIQRCAQVPFSVLAGPVGAHAAERLAGTIVSWDRWHGCVWFRAGALRPVTLARELADACRHRWGIEGAHPPVAVAPDGTAGLRPLLSRAPSDAVVVVETDSWGLRGMRRLVADLRPVLVERRVSVLVVTEAWWRRRTAADTGTPDFREAGAAPPAAAGRDNLRHLARRRPAVLHDVLAAAQIWGWTPCPPRSTVREACVPCWRT